MLVAPIPSVYEVELPRNVQQLLANMAIAVTFGFDVAVSELDCIGLGGYLPKLHVWLLTPPVVVLAIVLLHTSVAMIWGLRRPPASADAPLSTS